MYIVVVKNKVEHVCRESYLQTSRKFAASMKEVAGCKNAYVLEDENGPDMIVNVEHWESKEAYDSYDSHVFMMYKPELKKGFLGNTAERYLLNI